jgi:cytochrome c-type biogenesis protein CcmH
MTFRALFFSIMLALLGGALLTGAVLAQATPPPSDDQVNAIAKQLYCPVCENIPLDVCPTQACAQWRELIREKLAAGWDEKQIKDYFVNQYGDRVLAEPPRRGLNWLVYLLPPVFILGGALLVFRVLRGMRASTAPSIPAAPTPPVQPQNDYLKRMEEELKKRE